VTQSSICLLLTHLASFIQLAFLYHLAHLQDTSPCYYVIVTSLPVIVQIQLDLAMAGFALDPLTSQEKRVGTSHSFLLQNVLSAQHGDCSTNSSLALA